MLLKNWGSFQVGLSLLEHAISQQIRLCPDSEWLQLTVPVLPTTMRRTSSDGYVTSHGDKRLNSIVTAQPH